MPRTCKSCGGTYEAVQRDGAAYFHECSPEVITTHAVETGGVITKPEVRAVRQGGRNENLDDSPAAVKAARGGADPNAPLPIKSEGAGAQ